MSHYKYTNKQIKKLLDANPFMLCRLWSGEYNLWWRCNSAGYTANKLDAGLYTCQEAYNITSKLGKEKKVTIHPILEITVLGWTHGAKFSRDSIGGNGYRLRSPVNDGQFFHIHNQ